MPSASSTSEYPREWRAQLRRICPLATTLVIAACHAIVSNWHALTSPGWETPAILLVLGLLVAFHACQKALRTPDEPRKTQDSVTAWTSLMLFFLLAWLPLALDGEWLQGLCLFLFLLAPVSFFSGTRKVALGAAPLFLFCVVLPMHVEIFLALSHPLRLLATMLTGMILKPFYADLSYHLTVLRLADTELPITDVCSGIDQLEALLLLGYLLVRYQQTKTLWRVVQYAFCVPAVIFANVIRLVAVVILYHSPIGARVLDSPWHTWLGYAQVLLAVLLMWGVGELIRHAESPVKEEKQA